MARSLNICVFCSASDLEEKYTAPARELAKMISAKGHTLVWGGSDVGVMGVLAAGVLEAGGRIVGVSVESLKDKAHKNAHEMIVAKDLAERKTLMLQRSDGIVVLPGGVGTLDEATDIIASAALKYHSKPLVFLNTDDFYAGLQTQIQRMENEGFIRVNLAEIMDFATTPIEALRFIETESG